MTHSSRPARPARLATIGRQGMGSARYTLVITPMTDAFDKLVVADLGATADLVEVLAAYGYRPVEFDLIEDMTAGDVDDVTSFPVIATR